MTTIINAAVTAMVSALQGAPAVAPVVGRVVLRQFSQDTATAVVVRPLRSDASEGALATDYPISWTSAVAVECYARAIGATAPDVAVDAVLEAAYTRLMADPTLGGVTLSLQPQQVAYDFDADGEKTACATLVFHVFQRANAGTLS